MLSPYAHAATCRLADEDRACVAIDSAAKFAAVENVARPIRT
jgi:hypothetical protein